MPLPNNTHKSFIYIVFKEIYAAKYKLKRMPHLECEMLYNPMLFAVNNKDGYKGTIVAGWL